MIWWPTQVPTLQSGLITLRKPEERDIVSIYDGVKDPMIPKYTRIPANYPLANAEHYVRERSPNGFTRRTELQLVIEYDEEFVGAISFHSMALEDARTEIGYWLTVDARGKGIATASTKLLTQFGFENIGFYRIEALINASNLASQRVILNSGFQQEGVLREKCCRDDGSREDMVIFSALRNQWGNS